MNNKKKLIMLEARVSDLYEIRNKDLLFHGWPHILFVRAKSIEIARSIKANEFIVESSAIVHDLNYLIETKSTPSLATEMRRKILTACQYSETEINTVEKTILDADISSRLGIENLSKESMALSDADTLFKVLPIVPVIFTPKYLEESHSNLLDLASKITTDQNPLMEQGKYFYTEYAKHKYSKWARTNLVLWNNIVDCLSDESVSELLNNIS